MNGFAQTEEVTVTNLESINSSKMEFGAVPYGNGLLFTSTNGEKFNGKIDKCNTDDYFAKLFYADPDNSLTEDGMRTEADMLDANGNPIGGNGCGFTNAMPISIDSKGKFHDGAPTISPNGNQMIFARNYPGKSNFLNACNDGDVNLRLMSAEKVGNEWVNVQELPLGEKDFNTAHPAFSRDGNCVYFSSDRPDGVGGMDLYKVCREGGGWTAPMNLGAPINTTGNEVFPHDGADGNFYYSSSGMGGMGGLDVYSTSMADGSWSTPASLGAPFNSSADDLGFTVTPDGQSGYLTSNRPGGKGGDDIYCWKINKAPVELVVEDAVTRGRIDNSLVKIKETTQTKDYTTDANGMAIPDITYRRTYELEVDEPGYEYWSKSVSASELASTNPYVIPLVKKSFPLGGNVIFEDESIAPDSRVVLYNLITGDSVVINADAAGKFDLDINCLDDYELIAYKDDKVSSKTPLPASSIDCNGGENAVTLIIPKPAPVFVAAPVCNCSGNPNPDFNIQFGAPKSISRLGAHPQFGNSSNLSGPGFYFKLKNRYDKGRDREYLDAVFRGMGYSGFAEATEFMFAETTLVPGITGNMGYGTRHKVKYVTLNTRGADLEAFRIKAANGCDVHFMKTCGNFFFFCAR